MKEVITIYVLRDPRTNEVRYVGKTHGTIRERIRQHLSDAKFRAVRRHAANWFRQLLELGLMPTGEAIEVCKADDWVEREMFWIAHYRAAGCKLTNSTVGGEGTHGFKMSAESRRKISEGNKGKPVSEARRIAIGLRMTGNTYCRGKKRSRDAVEKTAAAHRGRKRPAETGERISLALKGRTWSAHEIKMLAQLHESNRGRKRSDEVKARKSAAMKGRPMPPEAIAKAKLANTGRKFSEERKAKMSEQRRAEWAKRRANGTAFYSDEARANMSAAQKRSEGKGQRSKDVWVKRREEGTAFHSEETKALIGARTKEALSSPEKRKKLSVSQKKRVEKEREAGIVRTRSHSAESRARISAGTKKGLASKEVRARMSNAHIQLWNKRREDGTTTT